MQRNLVSAVLVAAALMSSAPETRSQPGQPHSDISAELVVGEVSTIADPFTGWIGVRVRLGPGWKIYWKAPGDAGLPPEFDWSSSTNVATAEVHWPAPHRTSMLGVESIGYTGEVLFPVKLQIEDPDYDTKIDLKLVLYACSRVCIREERGLSVELSHPSSPDAQSVIDRWQDRVPAETSDSLTIGSIELLRSTPPRLRVEATSTLPFEHPDLFVATAPSSIYAGTPEIEVSGHRAVLTVSLEGGTAASQKPLNVELALVDGPRAVQTAMSFGEEQSLPIPSGGTSGGDAVQHSTPQSWWAVAVTAWLGGLILNLMPCVFPVLSLKLLSLVGHGVAEQRALRSGLIASAAGVIVSFLVLATALTTLKATGTTIGWGIQFQDPIFLAVMAAVIAFFAANLLGFFEVSLPSGVMNALVRRGMSSSVPSQFAGGFVATLLATPCSAPFVGTAISFALSRGNAEIYAVFGVLGVGMATPQLAVACIPSLAAIVPRPGRWMLWLKRAMALPLLATSAWLVTLVGGTAGHLPGLLTAAALAIGLAVLWWRSTDPWPGPIAVSCALIFASGVAFVVMTRPTSVAETATQKIQWHSFSELDGLVRSGHTVFLDVTADWCVTCKVNKALVVNDRAITQRLSDDVVAVRGDWTKPDPRIAEYLKTFGRYGLPFNVVFGPQAPSGIVLPELLTRNAVLSAFAASSEKSNLSIELK